MNLQASVRQWRKDNLLYNYPITDEQLSKYPDLLHIRKILVSYRKSVVGFFDVFDAQIVDKQHLVTLGYPIKSSRHKADTKYVLYKLKESENEIPAIDKDDYTQIVGDGVKLG